MANYDEDLHENHFFKALVETNNALYNKAADNKWMVSLEVLLVILNSKMQKCITLRYAYQGAILYPG